MSVTLPYLLAFERGHSVLTFQTICTVKHFSRTILSLTRTTFQKGRGECQEEGFLNVIGLEKLLTDDDELGGSQWVSR